MPKSAALLGAAGDEVVLTRREQRLPLCRSGAPTRAGGDRGVRHEIGTRGCLDCAEHEERGPRERPSRPSVHEASAGLADDIASSRAKRMELDLVDAPPNRSCVRSCGGCSFASLPLERRAGEAAPERRDCSAASPRFALERLRERRFAAKRS